MSKVPRYWISYIHPDCADRREPWALSESGYFHPDDALVTAKAAMAGGALDAAVVQGATKDEAVSALADRRFHISPLTQKMTESIQPVSAVRIKQVAEEYGLKNRLPTIGWNILIQSDKVVGDLQVERNGQRHRVTYLSGLVETARGVLSRMAEAQAPKPDIAAATWEASTGYTVKYLRNGDVVTFDVLDQAGSRVGAVHEGRLQYISGSNGHMGLIGRTWRDFRGSNRGLAEKAGVAKAADTDKLIPISVIFS